MIRPGVWRRELAVPLQSIQAELNRLFEEYWQAPDPSGHTGARSAQPQAKSSPNGTAASHAPAVWTPAIDLWEASGELVLVVDLPGVDPSTIDLSLTGTILTIRGEKVAPNVVGTTPDQPARGRVRERVAGSFHRQVTLVDDVDFDRVQAQAKDGVLTVRLPKRDVAQARTIPIQPATS